MARTEVLLVEDDDEIVDFLRRGLELEGYSVVRAGRGEDALELVSRRAFPIIILDLMLPGIDGLEVCERLRAAGVESIILMLTARDSPESKIEGLQTGADDYLTKPFSFAELLARLQAIRRRVERRAAVPEPVLTVADLRLDLETKTATRGSRALGLTATEFGLLEQLMRNPGRVQGRGDLLREVWDRRPDLQTNIVDVYIRYLRRKIDAPGEPPLIRTVRGFGYTIEVPGLPDPGEGAD